MYFAYLCVIFKCRQYNVSNRQYKNYTCCVTSIKFFCRGANDVDKIVYFRTTALTLTWDMNITLAAFST